MAVRDYEFQIFHGPGPAIDIYVWDNNDHELTSTPIPMSESKAKDEIEFLTKAAEYFRRNGVTKLHVDKL